MAINLLTTLKSTDTKPLAEGTVTGLKLHPLGKGRASWMLWYQSPTRSKDAAPRKMKLGESWLSSDSKKAEGMSVVDAKAQANALRKLIENKIDPMDQRDEADAKLALAEREEKQADRELREFNEENARRVQAGLKPLPVRHTFNWVKDAWLEYKRKTKSPTYIYKMDCALTKWASPVLGNLHINEINDEHIAQVYRALMDAQVWAVLMHIKSNCRSIFAWARNPEQGKLRTTGCPMFDSDDHRPKGVRVVHHAAATKPSEIRTLILGLRNAPTATPRKGGGAMPMYMNPIKALQFTALTAQRNMTVTSAQFDEMHDLDGTHPKWIIPAAKMKAERWEKEAGLVEDHVVFLSRQAVDMIRAQRALHPHSVFVFPARDGMNRMPHTALARRLRELGFGADESNTTGVACRPHGMRAMLRTAAEDQLGYKDLRAMVLEMILAHRGAQKLSDDDLAKFQRALDGGMRSTYRRVDVDSMKALYEAEAHKLMQGWADYLDQLVDPATSISGLTEQPLPQDDPVALAA